VPDYRSTLEPDAHGPTGILVTGLYGASDSVDSKPTGEPSGVGHYARYKPVIDVILAMMMLLITAPMILLTMFIVRLTSRGPGLYAQKRLGLNGKPFFAYKIRTMFDESERKTGPHSIKGDPRVTFVGRFIRWSHLDELPMLVNIIRGEMSLIGPRPERPKFFGDLVRAFPQYGERLRVRPGVSGLAQVEVPPDTDLAGVRLKLAFDIFYVRHYGPLLDLKILFATTLKYLGVPTGAYVRLLGLPASVTEVAIADAGGKSFQDIVDASTIFQSTLAMKDYHGGQMNKALVALLEVSLYSAQYLSLLGVHRRLDALEMASAELEKARAAAGYMGGMSGRKIRRLVKAWEVLLRIERDAMILHAKARPKPIQNPFITGNPIKEMESNMFAGRKELTDQIALSMDCHSRLPILLLHGPRRMGKTSVLNQLPCRLGPKFAPALLDCQNPAILERGPSIFFGYFSQAVVQGVWRRGIQIAPPCREGLSSNPFAEFDSWLDEIERAVPGDIRVVIGLDEYERLQAAIDAGWGRLVLEALRHMVQHRNRIGLVFAGVHTFAEVCAVWTDCFINSRAEKVSFLSPDEISRLLKDPVPEFDMIYTRGAIETIISATNGQPFLAQAVAFELVQLLNQRGRKEATQNDVAHSITRALSSAAAYFDNIWAEAGPPGRAILGSVAVGTSVLDNAKELAWLQEQDVLDEAGNFLVPMVGRWVRDRVTRRGASAHLESTDATGFRSP
jgi:lipopolysaccharide/colanic/teichoic acid biosynthesis glycosyltransferase